MNGANSLFRRAGNDKGSQKPGAAHRSRSPVRAVIYGLLTAVIVCMLILVAASLIMSRSDISAQYAGIAANAAITLSSFAAGFTAARVYRKRLLYMGAAMGLIYYVLLMVAGLIFFRSGISVTALTKLVMMVAAAAIGGIASGMVRRKRRI